LYSHLLDMLHYITYWRSRSINQQHILTSSKIILLKIWQYILI